MKQSKTQAFVYVRCDIYTLRSCVGEGREMHLADCRDEPQDYNTGQDPDLTGLHVFQVKYCI